MPAPASTSTDSFLVSSELVAAARIGGVRARASEPSLSCGRELRSSVLAFWGSAAVAMAPPPPPYARVMEDMVKGREYATQLKALLRESPEASRLVDRILHAISLTIQTAKAAAAAAEEEEEEEASEVQSEVTCTGKRKAAGGAGKRAAACRRSPAIVGCDEEREGSGGRTRVAQVRAEGDPELQAPKGLLPVHAQARPAVRGAAAGAAPRRRPGRLHGHLHRRAHLPGPGHRSRRRAPRGVPPHQLRGGQRHHGQHHHHHRKRQQPAGRTQGRRAACGAPEAAGGRRRRRRAGAGAGAGGGA
uniref:Uncharacterized protein n=1 Tax=Zea mays TaxID=4577 RepID=A0A804RCU0_MAIZE